MKIAVTQQHIAAGKQGSGWDCPVAIALRDATGQPYCVGYRTCAYSKGEGANQVVCYNLPPDVPKRIWLYDTTERMEPFTFELPIAENVA